MAINILQGSIGQGLVNLGSVRKGDTVQLVLTIDGVTDLDVSKFKLKSSGHEQTLGFGVNGNTVIVDLDGQFTEGESGLVYMDLEVVSLSGKITTSKFYMLLNDTIVGGVANGNIKRVVGGKVIPDANGVVELDLGQGVYNLEVILKTIYHSFEGIFIQINNGDLINLQDYNEEFKINDIKVTTCKIINLADSDKIVWRGIV